MPRHGSGIDPPNRFERVRREEDLDHLEWDQEYLATVQNRPIRYLDDRSQSIVTKNDSPDIPFTYSLNPYRGCAHGCAYCYARNSHEYLGLNAGLDFETKIVVKHDAPALFRQFLADERWQVEPICFSGITDCYQPAERQFRLTRGCLEVAWQCRQPISIVTKNALVVRDLDLLAPMAAHGLVHVNISVTTLDAHLARVMEPRTSTPAARLRAMRMLADAQVPVRVMVAPVVPGLNDSHIASVLKAARDAGARSAAYVLLRLPQTVEPVFREWLHRTQPLQAEKVEHAIQQTRGGNLSSAKWGERLVGTGAIAEQIRQMFSVFRRKYGFGDLPPHECGLFTPPQVSSGQLRLF